jgi:drug/metabolite transporter (DMT)-like permease
LEKQESAYDRGRFTFYVCRLPFHVSRLADGALLLVALIWGATFVMVKGAVTTYPVFSFLALRFVFAALVMLPLVVLRRSRWRVQAPGRRFDPHFGVILSRSVPNVPQSGQQSEESFDALRTSSRQAMRGDSALESRRTLSWLVDPLRVTASDPSSPRRLLALAAPLLMGAALFAGYALQTFGLRLTTPAKAAFITGLSVVIVPVVSALVLRRRLGRGAWLGVGLATAGLALLTLNAGLTLNPGDLLVFGCAVAFAAQILLTGRFASRADPVLLAFGQIAVVAVLAGGAALLFERPSVPSVAVLFAAAFTGVLATSLAFGIQTAAQRFTSPTRTALIFATEPIFAALFSFLLVGELLGPRQLAGCALITAGMVTAEVMRNGGNDESCDE